MENKKNIAFTWWYSWGHIFPLVSIFNYLKEDNRYNFIWVWEESNLEEEIADKNKIKFLNIPCWKIRRYFDIRNFYEPLKNLTGIFFGIYYILKYKIDIVFSKWWFISLPLCIAAFILRKKIYIHESDTKVWIANKIISKIATKIFYSFENEKLDNKKNIFSWQILNPELIDYLDDLNLSENEKLEVLVIAWSQWSKTIFNALLKILPDLSTINFNIILWEKNLNFRDDFKKFPNIMVHDFITQKRLGKFLKKTDIAITRWWATTLWELNVFWIHSIIIPISDSAGNHQEENAKYFKEKFGSDIINEKDELELKLFRKLKAYKELRKNWLNLDKFFEPLKIIKKELEN
jgi:UDP-N-acetylglucosamine--N-acetylmuramyl-(pentapeptide) pyrophosphoryl-undecaprenol N-acetylglucosamine transferase